MKPIPLFEKNYTTAPSDNDIVKAIEGRYYVSMYYQSDRATVLNGHRLIEPYCFGTNDKGKKYLRAYVIDDSKKDAEMKKKGNFSRIKSVSKTHPKEPKGWRLFIVDDISRWVHYPRKFSKYRAGFAGTTDKQIPNVIAALDYSDFPKGENRNTILG